ncbi:hypothetical protein SAMN05428953_102182 [Mesorhizobium muleiense]|uniref:Uncharacterized protein n=1 Tax=Mesorhizobium muleiense TaxID=1004279 RepID=A0A1G8LAJ8_9HYPH|nr:hypothetical protein SAMN05428953_102182 [Mesorhizobium muleiense]
MLALAKVRCVVGDAIGTLTLNIKGDRYTVESSKGERDWLEAIDIEQWLFLPKIIAGEVDVFPSERREAVEEM